MLDWGIEAVFWLQNWMGAGWKGLMLFFSDIAGDAPGYILLVLLFYYVFDRTMGLRLLLILGISDAFNNLLKNIIAAGRPYQYDGRITIAAPEDGYGMPSGHAQNSGTVFGRLITGVKSLWSRIMLFLLIAGIGVSRVYLGVHTPEQVLAGWVLAGVFLWLALRFEAGLVDRLREWPLLKLGLTAAGGALGFTLAVLWITLLQELPPDVHARFELMDHAVQGAGLASGALLGGRLLWDRGGWALPESLWKKLLTFLVTLILSALLALVLEDRLLESIGSLGGLVFTAFCSRWILGLLVSYLLPRIYGKIGIG